jgi:hypothetical protein
MAVVAFRILDNIRQTLDDGIVLDGLEISAAEAARIMAPVQVAAETNLIAARAELERAMEEEVRAKAAAETQVLDATVGRGGIRSAKSNRPTATEQLTGRAADTAALSKRASQQKDINDAELKVRTKRIELEHAEREFAKWKRSIGPVNQAEFMQYGKDSVQPGYDYFIDLYVQPEGKLRNLFLAFRGAQIFDPLFIAGITLTAGYLLIDDLLRFGFEEFTPQFIKGLKIELPKLAIQAKVAFSVGYLTGCRKV